MPQHALAVGAATMMAATPSLAPDFHRRRIEQ
jgi:hypothetical protein